MPGLIWSAYADDRTNLCAWSSVRALWGVVIRLGEGSIGSGRMVS